MINITIDEKYLDDKQCDFFHYQETIELATCEYGKFYIVSRGELKVSYTNEDKEIYDCRNIDDIQRYYITNDDDYIEEQIIGNLYVDLGNWFEIELIDNNGEYIETTLTDDIFGDIQECINVIKNRKIDELLIKND